MDRRSFSFIFTLLALLVGAGLVFLYAQGYSFDRQTKTLEKTGMIVVKSYPDGARVYLNGKLAQATNATLTGLKGGLYDLKIEKDGFAPFQKEVPVKEELVTNLEALLVPLNPELKPLTGSGVVSPILSNSRDKILFLTPDRDRPGLWSLNLTGNLFSLIKGNLEAFVADQEKARLSLAEKIFISPNDDQLLVQLNSKGFFNLDLSIAKPSPQATGSATGLFEKWQAIEAKNKTRLAVKYKVPATLLKAATDSASLWSPDERRFLYALSVGKSLEYHVSDTTDPLGVGEKENYTVVRIEKTVHTRVAWFSDSKHLILATCSEETKEQVCLSGSVRLIRLDGTNNVQIYAGALSSTDVFPTPDGTKILILTSFNQVSQPNLYAIILR